MGDDKLIKSLCELFVCSETNKTKLKYESLFDSVPL